MPWTVGIRPQTLENMVYSAQKDKDEMETGQKINDVAGTSGPV